MSGEVGRAVAGAISAATPGTKSEGPPFLLVLAGGVAVVAAIAAAGSAALAAVTAGFGAPILALVALGIGRRVSRVQTGVRDDGKAIFARVTRRDLVRFGWQQHLRGIPVGRWAVLLGAASVASALVPWRAFLGLEVGAVIAGASAVQGIVAGIALVAVAVAVGRRFRRQVRTRLAQRARYESSLQFITGVSDLAWERAVWDLDEAARSIVIRTPHEAVAGAMKGVDRIAQALPGWTLDAQRSGSVAVLREMTADEHRQAQITADSDGLVVDLTELADGRAELTLPAGTSPAKADAVEAWLARTSGLSLVEWRPLDRRAIAARLTDAERDLRSRIATLLGTFAHEVTVAVESDAEGIRHLRIQAPAGRAADGESRAAHLRRVMLQAVPGAHADWLVAVDPISDEVIFERRERRALPSRVALDQLLPAAFDPEGWAQVVVGLDPEGRPVGQDLTTAPMAAVAGPTGSGKTVMLLADAAQRLARGHDLVIIDPTKGGADFASLEPFCLAFAREYDEAVAAIQAAYAEGQRRRSVLLREQEVKWADLSPAVRAAEGIRPLTVLIDEAASLLIAPQVPKGLPKDHLEVVAATELGAQKALLGLYIGKIARELRFVGVHLVLAMQRPDASILGGEVRSNLSHRVQLVAPGKPIGQTELQMLFPAPVVGPAFETISRFDDGQSRGLAVLAGDEGDVVAARIAYSPMREIPALLTARGVQPVPVERRFDLHPTAEGAPAPTNDDLFA